MTEPRPRLTRGQITYEAKFHASILIDIALQGVDMDRMLSQYHPDDRQKIIGAIGRVANALIRQSVTKSWRHPEPES